MNNRKYLLYIEIIKAFLHYILYFAILCIGLKLLDRKTNVLLHFFLLLPAAYVSLAIQKRTRHIWSFFLLHVLMIGGYAFLAPSPIHILLYLPYMFALLISGFKTRLLEEERPAANASLYLVSIFILLYFAAKYFKLPEITSYLFCWLIIYVLLYYINMYLINFEKFFRTHAGLSNVPIQKIKSTNHTLVLFFASLSLGVMVLFQYIPLNKLIILLKEIVLSIIKSILSFLKQFEGAETIPEQNSNDAPIDFSVFIDKEQVPSPFWEFFQKIITGFITFSVFAFVIGLVIFSLYKLYRLFYERKYTFLTDKTEFISPFDQKESLGFPTIKTFLERFRPAYGSAPRERIRKLFFKAVSSSTAYEEIKNSMTPKELSKIALGAQKEYTLFTNKNQGQKKISYPNGVESLTNYAKGESPQKQLTYYYEKARYGKEACTKEDLQRVKSLLHHVR
ncbi:hypothetical protein acsn021_10420 [Anaerocolumna cellulosilytica]|uniref:Uncharacterized protein n=1 Tax=Anaerocolumna cellulosilytica TaxID=433286 RepID=A0A6S6QQ55_9FIRM|nr:hypothetical protein [Anaerocolumna cellulosilytica]MBB5194529.1 hypothetical protein [Anaerocolumna cellulosilytica]BCJ93473.1 hypothetical protein acsn021_10420 [Anaerocolumna cellulosilytica]